MRTHIDVQIIHGRDGHPAFVVVPYDEWLASQGQENDLVPHEVVNLVFNREWTPMRAWREHLGLTQAEVAARAGMSQSAYSQRESAPIKSVRTATIRKIAAALGITPEQLLF